MYKLKYVVNNQWYGGLIMKTYQSSTKERKINFFKRHKVVLSVAASVIIVALIVTLSVVFTLPKKPVDTDTPVIDPPNVDVDVKPAVTMPITGATIGMDYADDKLVHWETLQLWKWHPAVDFVGSGDVVAIMDGTVTDIEKTSLEGNVVTITHDDGYVSIYKSLASEITVNVGDKVKSGDKIGVASSSMLSELNTGAHLHFELKKDGKYVDPATVLPIDEDK